MHKIKTKVMRASKQQSQEDTYRRLILTVIALPVFFVNDKYRLPPAGVEILCNLFKRKFLVQTQATLGDDWFCYCLDIGLLCLGLDKSYCFLAMSVWWVWTLTNISILLKLATVSQYLVT